MPTDLPTTLAPLESPAVASSEKVVFAMNEGQRKYFLSDISDEAIENWMWVDVEQMDEVEWTRTLTEIRPTVLVSCWSTPLVPDHLIESPDFPLRYVCHLAGSVRSVVSRKFVEQGGIVSNWGSSVSHAVAEHALFLTLATLRNLPEWRPQDMERSEEIWSSARMYRTKTLLGKKIGLHGFGTIARRLIELLAPFSVECRAYSHGVHPDFIRSHGAESCEDMEDLFRGSDILIECEALTEKSRGSVNRAILELLPNDAIFVNVGRGDVVDEEALISLAAAGRLRVACDVFQKEPLPRDSPFWSTPAVLVSPHIAGPTQDTLIAIGEHAVANILRFLKGEPVKDRITLDIYDRST